jgi:hypothetical protein
VGSVAVVVAPPGLGEDLSLERLSNWVPFRNSSRIRPLKLSIQAFCHGDPGSMKTVPVPLNRHQSAPHHPLHPDPAGLDLHCPLGPRRYL